MPILRDVVVDKRHLIGIGMEVQIFDCGVGNAVVSFNAVQDAPLGLLPNLLSLSELLEGSSLPGFFVDLVETEPALVGLLSCHCKIIMRWCRLLRCPFRNTNTILVFLTYILMVFVAYFPVEGPLPLGITNDVMQLLRLKVFRVGFGLLEDVRKLVVDGLGEWFDECPSLRPLFPFRLLHVNKIIIAI